MKEPYNPTSKSLIIWISLIAFVLNFIWENLHAGLYGDYDYFMKSIYFLGCTLGDVVLTFIIYGLVAVVLKDRYWIRSFNFRSFVIVLLMAGLVAFVAEWAVIELNFWSYNDKMPIIPVLKVGLSPFLAIAINPTLSFIFTYKILRQLNKANNMEI